MTDDTQAASPRTPAGDGLQPVPVRIIADDTGAGLTGPASSPARRRKLTRFQTYVLTASDPTDCILPESADRIVAFVQAIDNDIVLGPTKGVVGAGVNTAVGVPNPNGAYVPKSNTWQTRIDGSNPVYAGVTTTATASRVTVIETYLADE